MTQDDQNPTMEDFKKSREIISEDRLQGIRNGNSVEVIMRLELAQALRDERKGLEEELAGIRKRFDERLATPNEYEKHLIAKPLHERLKALEAENESLRATNSACCDNVGKESERIKQVKDLTAENARLKAELEAKNGN